MFPAWLAAQEDLGATVHRGLPAHWHNGGEPLGENLSCGLASTFVLTVNSGGGVKNTDSLVLMIEYQDFTAIFPGDAVGITEEFARANFSAPSRPLCSRRRTTARKRTRATARSG